MEGFTKEDMTIGTKKTITRRYRGVVMLRGKVIAKDPKSCSKREEALSRAQFIKDAAWLDAINETKKPEDAK